MPRVGKLFLALLLSFAPPLNAQTSPNPGFEALAAAASSARDAGRAEEAIRNYRAALQLHADWEEGWWYLGTILYDADKFAEAIPALRRVAVLDPKVGSAKAFLGLCEFETGDYSEAFTHLQSAQELGFADSPEVEKVALYHLGLLLNLHAQFDDATKLLAITFGPNHFTDQIKTALALALLRAPILPSQIDPSKDALIHAAGETAILLAARENGAALRHLEDMLRDYPDTPYLHYQYGLALLEASRYQQAEVQLKEEVKLTRQSPLPWVAVAQALDSQGKHDEATSARLRGKELAKQSPDADASQATRYSLNRDALNPAASVTVTAGRPPDSVTAHAESNDTSFEDAVRNAESARQAGRTEEAAAWYQKALQLHASWPEGWRQLGTLQYMENHFPDAISALYQAVALDSKQPDSWALLGLSEFETRDYKNSLVHLERARNLGFSGNVNAVSLTRYRLALLLIRNGDFDPAIDTLIPAIGASSLADEIQFAMGIALLRIPALPEEIKPDKTPLVRTAGEAAVLLSRSRYTQALPIFERLVAEHATTPFVHYAYGDALAATSMFEEAQTQLREEVKINPNNTLPYLRLASVCLSLHESADALSYAKKAVDIAPESSEAHYLLGRSFLEAGDAQSAVRELEQARRLAPNSPKVRLNLARAYAITERPSEAEQERVEFERLNALPSPQQKSTGDPAAR